MSEKAPTAGPSRAGYHRLATVLTCPQQFAYRYRLNLTPVRESEGRAAGALMHIGLMHHYLGLAKRPEARDPFEAMRTAPARIATTYSRVEPVLREYGRHYRAEPFRVLDVEREFEITIAGRPFTARIDLVVDQGGAILFYDHKCLPGDAVVLTDAGPRQVAEIAVAAEPFKVAAWQNSQLLWATAGISRAGVHDVYAIGTVTGRTLRLGYNHPALTKRGWVRACDVRVGDRLALAVNRPDLPDVDIPAPLLVVIGCLIADGSMTGLDMKYTKTARTMLDYYKVALRELGLVESRTGRNRFAEYAPSGRAPFVALHPRSPLHAMLDAIGVTRSLSAERFLPPLLLRLSRRQVGILMGALWSGDGCIALVQERSKPNAHIRIVYTSRSRRLASQVGELLLSLGILSTTRTYAVSYKDERRPYWQTAVVGRESKRKFLSSVINGSMPSPRCRDAAVEALAVLGARDPRGGARVLLDGQVYWDLVDAVVCAGRELVFDIEVPGPNTFVAEGFITHNTSGTSAGSAAREWEMSGQMIGQDVIGHAVVQATYGKPFGGAVINAIRIGAAPEFARHPVTVAPSLRGPWMESMRYAGEVAEGLAATDPWRYPRNHGACMSRFGLCENVELCRRGRFALGEFVEEAP